MNDKIKDRLIKLLSEECEAAWESEGIYFSSELNVRELEQLLSKWRLENGIPQTPRMTSDD